MRKFGRIHATYYRDVCTHWAQLDLVLLDDDRLRIHACIKDAIDDGYGRSDNLVWREKARPFCGRSGESVSDCRHMLRMQIARGRKVEEGLS